MELVGGLFYTSWGPSHGSTTSASTTRAWRAPNKDHTTSASTARAWRALGRGHTTSAQAWGYFCYLAYYSYCSTSSVDYIWAVHYHIGFGVLRPGAYLSNTHHHPFCSFSADGWDACASGLTDCYSPPDSAALGTPASASTGPSHILSAYSSNRGYHTSRGPDSTTSGWASYSHSYAWGCIISTWGSHCLIIGHLFILLYLYYINEDLSLFWCFINWD